MKGSERNAPCPSGSGLKRKRCEPAHPDLTPGMTPEMEAKRQREMIAEWYAARRRGRMALTAIAGAL